MIVSYRCSCGVALRYRKNRYEPVAGSSASPAGHSPAVVITDGVPRDLPNPPPCTARTTTPGQRG